MKFFVKSTICLAGALALNAASRADTAALPGNPYAMVVERNVFGLVSPPPPEIISTPAAPLPKITPNGIMSIFGQLQVLFKVAGGAPGKEKSYILFEGQAQDEIEVTKINEKAGIITFNNHGFVQEIQLANAPSTSAPAGANPAIPSFGRPVPGGAGFSAAFTSRAAAGIPIPTAPPIPASAPATPARKAYTMTPEEQTLMIEVQRQQYLNEGDPTAKIMPPTELTPPPDSGDGSTPALPVP